MAIELCTGSPCADMIEEHRIWMHSTGRYTDNTIRDSGEVLYRIDRDLATGQRAAGDPVDGLAGALPEELEAWLAAGRAWGRRKWSRETIANYRKALVRFYGWALAHDWISYDPSTQLVAPKINPDDPNPATDRQVAYIMQYATDPFWINCALAGYAGFRPMDIANARREHFRLDLVDVDGELVEAPTIRVRGKGDKPAILPCDPVIWEAVRDLPKGPITRRPDGRAAGKPVTAATVATETGYYLHHKLHLDITLRNLRAWYATTMLAEYRDHRVVQELMRHSSLQTLQRYTAVVAARKRAAQLTLPRFGARAAVAVDAGAGRPKGPSRRSGSPG